MKYVADDLSRIKSRVLSRACVGLAFGIMASTEARAL